MKETARGLRQPPRQAAYLIEAVRAYASQHLEHRDLLAVLPEVGHNATGSEKPDVVRVIRTDDRRVLFRGAAPKVARGGAAEGEAG